MNNPSMTMVAIGLSAVLGGLFAAGPSGYTPVFSLAPGISTEFSLSAGADSSRPSNRNPGGAPLAPAGPVSSYPSPPRRDRPRPWLAAAEVVGINLGIWAILHYVTDAHYAYLSWETMRDNVRDSFEWDQSRYFVNFYHHPYHGYLYFNASRANGLGYWASALGTFGGSLMWEMVLETYRPSINDLVTTTNGGCVYGEIGYRFSARVRKPGARGLGRIWRETVAAILDPVGGLNRLLNGRKDDAPGAPGCPDGETALAGEFALAGPVLGRSGMAGEVKTVPIVAFTLRYGDPFGGEWGGKPFDVFAVQGRLRCGPDRPHLSLSAGGTLSGWAFQRGADSAHFLGVDQHYEYYGFDTLRIGGSSFTGSLMSRFALSPKARLTTAVRLGWLVLGGTEDFAAVVGERRVYNFGTGWTAALDAGLCVDGFEFLSAGWKHYGLVIVKGSGGKEFWDILLAEARIPVWKRLGLGLQCEYCRRSTNFEDLPRERRRLFEARAFLTCQF